MGFSKTKSTPPFYLFIRGVLKWGLSLFFQNIEVRHGENMPKQGPALFVANHPNSTMDALILSTVTQRMVHYIGHAGLFTHKIKAWLLRNCGVIPVHRRPQASDTRGSNVEAFQSCYQVLEAGGAISIFPEGISEEARHVHKLKTGAARIVLEAEHKNDYQLGVKIIPIGLHFFSRSRFRSKVLVNVGRPMDLAPFLEINKYDNVKAVQELTAQIQNHLVDLTVNIPRIELEQIVKDLEIIYRDELIQESESEGKSPSPSVLKFVISQKMAECVEYYDQHKPLLVKQMQKNIDDYKRKLKRFHLKDAMLKEKTSMGELIKEELAILIKALIGLPLAAYGIINNYLPYRITEKIAKKFMQERTKILTALFLGGGITFIIFYGAQTFLVWYYKGLVWSLIYLISLPLSGFFALAYTKRFREERERISFSFFIFTKRHLIGKMRLARRQLISELNAVKEEYLKIMETKSE